MNTIVFDLDGVLLDFCDVHYDTLNQAITEIAGQIHTINRVDHETKYNGRSTRDKLTLLGLEVEPIYKRKQELTIQHIHSDIHSNERLISMLRELKDKGYKLGCASNCIRDTVFAALRNLGILEFFDAVLSNQDVTNAKPQPDIYLKAIDQLNVSPKETIIFEDSWVGIRAAVSSGAHCQRVRKPGDLTIDFVLKSIDYCNAGGNPLTKDVNVVIPMAGNGSRFANAGYIHPKPLIPVFGKPMIQWVIDNIGIDAQYLFIIRKNFEKEAEFLRTITPRCKIIALDNITDGAARTVLMTEKFIDNDNPLIIANSDQFIEFSSLDFVLSFLYNPNEIGFSAKISTFDGLRNPKWSYAAVDEKGNVTTVREKDPISDHATTGIYMWRYGSDFVRFTKQMIAKDIRINNEYYVAPVFNEALDEGMSICISECQKMWGLGTPEDLNVFISSFRSPNH